MFTRAKYIRGLVLGLSVAMVLWMAPGCGETYSQQTPDAVMASAKKMIQDRQARHLPDLIYADNPRMRDVLNELGRTLESLQTLASSVQEKYPAEIKKMREDAAAAAARGESSSLVQRLSSIVGAGRGRRGRGADGGRDGPPGDEQQDQLAQVFRQLFADPYGFLEDQQGKLSVKQVTDDTAAVLWDGKALFGVGLAMRREKDRWYIVLPTSVPPLSRAMPTSDEGWEVLGEMMGMATNMLDDLNDDVRKGRAAHLDDLARLAGDKAFLPAAMVMIAYGKVMEEDRKAARGAAPTSDTPAASGAKIPDAGASDAGKGPG